jgi:hypothetical protein
MKLLLLVFTLVVGSTLSSHPHPLDKIGLSTVELNPSIVLQASPDVLPNSVCDMVMSRCSLSLSLSLSHVPRCCYCVSMVG